MYVRIVAWARAFICHRHEIFHLLSFRFRRAKVKPTKHWAFWLCSLFAFHLLLRESPSLSAYLDLQKRDARLSGPASTSHVGNPVLSPSHQHLSLIGPPQTIVEEGGCGSTFVRTLSFFSSKHTIHVKPHRERRRRTNEQCTTNSPLLLLTNQQAFTGSRVPAESAQAKRGAELSYKSQKCFDLMADKLGLMKRSFRHARLRGKENWAQYIHYDKIQHS